MRVIDAATVRAHLPWARMMSALEAALRDGVEAPLRGSHVIDVPESIPGTLLTMPAWRRGAYLGVKLVTVFPGNAARGERTVAAAYVLFDARDGRALALIDGEELTRRRTAAASVYAARHLARRDARHLVMAGAGRAAGALVEAYCSAFPLERVSLWSRTLAHAASAARAMATAGLPVADVAGLAAVLHDADIVSCATLSTVPIVEGALLPPGCHVDLVGAFRAHMRESDDEVMRRAALIVVDERRAALAEAGDIVQAIASGAITEARIGASLRDLADGSHPGRVRRGDITVFKSVGFALEDLAAAQAVYESVCATA